MLDPLIVGVFAVAISLVGAGRPSFWYDEAATISASYSRSLAQLWQMMGNVDAVHGLYYVLMHGWFTIFPTDGILVARAERSGSRRCRGRGGGAG